eukprot:14947056-Alexandrium_andersonii.AAC.1
MTANSASPELSATVFCAVGQRKSALHARRPRRTWAAERGSTQRSRRPRKCGSQTPQPARGNCKPHG